jgi:RNA polymerase sigma-70 factor, ECF subfamily
MIENSDILFVQEICKGNKAAFDAVFRKYYPILRNYANRLLKDPMLAEDMVQEAFFKLWIKREQLSAVRLLNQYILSMVHNLCIDQIRKRSINDNLQIDLSDLEEQHGLYDSILHYLQPVIAGEELSARLSKAIEVLPLQCRVVFTLSRKFGFRNSEIAELQGISVKAVEKHITRALSQLHDHFKDILPLLLAILSGIK